MTEKLKIVECKGFTKEQAFSTLDFSPNRISVRGSNATQAWNKAGNPIPGTYAFKQFAIQQLEEKTHNEPGTGLYIVIDSPVCDIRKRPYNVINVVTEGTRTWKIKYQVRGDKLIKDNLPTTTTDEAGEVVADSTTVNVSIAEIGTVYAEYDTKAEALYAAKELTTKFRRDFTIIPVKVPDIAPVAAYCVYTPSAGTKEGTFIAFGYNKD